MSRFAWREARGPADRSSAEDAGFGRRQVVVDLVDQPEAQSGRGIEALTRDEVAAGGALTELANHERRDHRRDDPELHLGECEDGGGVRDRDVRACDQPHAAPERVPLDECDDRCGARVDRFEHAPERVRVGDVGVVVELGGCPHPLDVRARAEALALATQDDGAGSTDVDECLGSLRDQERIEGVPRLRARQNDPKNVVVPLHP